jgi:hypothetical protein
VWGVLAFKRHAPQLANDFFPVRYYSWYSNPLNLFWSNFSQLAAGNFIENAGF